MLLLLDAMPDFTACHRCSESSCATYCLGYLLSYRQSGGASNDLDKMAHLHQVFLQKISARAGRLR